MKNLTIILTILPLTVFGGCSVNTYRGMHWDIFLENPSKNSLVELENEVSSSAERCSWADPKNHGVVSVEAGQRLYRLIAEGNEFAFQAGLLVMRCLDGGELEDFHRSAGHFFEAKPSVFLKMAEEKNTPETTIKSMLTMLPFDTVDNIDRAITAVERRIAILEAISDSSFDVLKKTYLSFLEDQKAMLSKVKKEIGESNSNSSREHSPDYANQSQLILVQP
jgi:hypothetical protein